jgi:hypothetical protein
MVTYFGRVFIVLAAFSSCKSIDAQQPGDLATGKSLAAPCFGDRKFSGDPGFGFDFNATRADMGHAYWMSLASVTTYRSVTEAEKMIDKLGEGSNSVKFKFLSKDRDQTSDSLAHAFMIDFSKGDLVLFRGTHDARDVAADADVSKNLEKAYFGGKELGDLKIHQGFWNFVDEEISEILWHYLSWQEDVSYDVGSPEAFEAISRTIRGITMKADQDTFDDTIGIMKEFGLLVTGEYSERDTIMREIATWKKLEMGLAQAHQDALVSSQSTRMNLFEKASKETLEEKHKIARRLHPFWRFKKYKPLWLGGHSLGGSQAIVAAFRLFKLGIPVKGIVTFGAATPGNLVFKELMESVLAEDGISQNTLRFVHGNDGPALLGGIFNLNHVGQPVYIDDHQNFYFHQESDNSALSKMLTLYPGNKLAKYYSTDRPEAMPTIPKIALEKMVSDHTENLYLELIENFVFGKGASGCAR